MTSCRAFGAVMILALAPCFAEDQPDIPRTPSDPNAVVDQSLGRLFSGRDYIPPGDRRGLKMSTTERYDANDAGRVFNTFHFRLGYGYEEGLIYDPRFATRAQSFKTQLKQTIKKHLPKKALTDEEAREVAGALLPFLRKSAIEAQLQGGQYVIPPKSKCRYRFNALCLDKDWASPRTGERMRIIPIESLLPGRLADVYRRVVWQSAKGGANHVDVQGLIWTLRQIASDIEGKSPITITERQKQLLNEAIPNGYAVFEAVRRPLGRSTLPQDLENLVRREVNDAIGRQRESGPFVTRVIEDEQMTKAVEEQMERLRNMAISEPIPENNSHYSRLAQDVYARVVYGSVDVQIANNSGAFYIFDPTAFAAQSERQTQRMGLQACADCISATGQQPLTQIPTTAPIAESPIADRVIFVNGIMTPWNHALCQARALHEKLGVPVTLAYNEKLSWHRDLTTAWTEYIGKDERLVQEWQWSGTAVTTPAYLVDSYPTLSAPNKITTPLTLEILEGLKRGERIGLLGHSEGTLIACDAINALVKAKAGQIELVRDGHRIPRDELADLDLQSIHLVLAGGAEASEVVKINAGTAIEIRHERDWVAETLPFPADPLGVTDSLRWLYYSLIFLDKPDIAEILKDSNAPHLFGGLRHHDFMTVYYPHITLNLFRMTGPPLKLTGEPSAHSPCDHEASAGDGKRE